MALDYAGSGASTHLRHKHLNLLNLLSVGKDAIELPVLDLQIIKSMHNGWIGSNKVY